MARTRKPADAEAPVLRPAFPKPTREPKVRKRLKPRNVERHAARLAEDFGELAAAVRRLPCCVAGCRRDPTDPAHVVSRGAGGHAWITVDGVEVGNIAPLCHPHHTGGFGVTRPQHGIGTAAFEAENRLELRMPEWAPRAYMTLAEVAAAVGEWFKAGRPGADSTPY